MIIEKEKAEESIKRGVKFLTGDDRPAVIEMTLRFGGWNFVRNEDDGARQLERAIGGSHEGHEYGYVLYNVLIEAQKAGYHMVIASIPGGKRPQGLCADQSLTMMLHNS